MKKHKMEIKATGDFENDPQGGMDAMANSGFILFIISESWYDDERAQKEWRFAKDLDKPMIYILRESGKEKFRPDMFTPNLIATINDYGNQEETAMYVQAFMATFEKNLDKK